MELCSNMAHYGIDPIELKKLDIPKDIIDNYINIKKNINKKNITLNNEPQINDYRSLYNNSDDDSVMDMEIEDEEEKNSSIVVINKYQDKINQNNQEIIINNSTGIKKTNKNENENKILDKKENNLSNSLYRSKDDNNKEEVKKIHSEIDINEHEISSTETSNLNSPIINSFDNSSINSKDFTSDIENSIYSLHGYHKTNKYSSNYSRYHYIRKPDIKDSSTKPFLPNTGPVRCIIELSDSEDDSSDEEDNINQNKIKQLQLNIDKHKQLDPDKIKRLLVIEKKKQEMMKKIATMENLKAKKNNKYKSLEDNNNTSSESKDDIKNNKGIKNNTSFYKKSKLNESIAFNNNESLTTSKASSLNGLNSDDELSSGISTPIKNNSNELNLQHLMDNNLESSDLVILNKTLKKKEIEINILKIDKKKLEIEYDKIQEKLKEVEKITNDTKEKIDNYMNQIKICEKLLEKNQQLYQEFNSKSSEMKNKINLKSQLIITISKDVKKYKDKIEKIKDNQSIDSFQNIDKIDKENSKSVINETFNKNDEKNNENSDSCPHKKRIQEDLPSQNYLIKRKKINKFVLFDELIMTNKLNIKDNEKTNKKSIHIQIKRENHNKIEFLFKSRNNLQKTDEIIDIFKKIKFLKNNKIISKNYSEINKNNDIFIDVSKYIIYINIILFNNLIILILLII